MRGGKGRMSYKEGWDQNHFLNSLIKKIFLRNKIKFKNILMIFMVAMKDNTHIMVYQ